MSTFYLNVDSTGVDKLLMGPGIYWSYATDGTSYTLTPVFDTTLITLPSDVQVWYSNDGTNFAYSPAWITNRTGDTITVTVASSTTVTAKLYYASGTVVTDENDAEVASVSTVIGGGSESLVPGNTPVGSWTATAVPSAQTGTFRINDTTLEPMASFIEAPVNATTDNTYVVSVVADHVNDIEKVTFIANNGTPVDVTTASARAWAGLNANIPQTNLYTVSIDLSGQSAGVPVEVRAIVYPVHGQPRVLQGDPLTNPTGSSVAVQEGTNSIYVTKVAGTVNTNVSTVQGLRTAINSADFTDTTRQHTFTLTGTLHNWNDSVSVSVATNPYVPIKIVGGQANRGTSTYDASVPNNGAVATPNSLTITNSSGGLFVELENLSIYQGTTSFRHDIANFGTIIRNCTITREAQSIANFRGTTLTGNPAFQVPPWSDPDNVPGSIVVATRLVRESANFSSPSGTIIGDLTTFTTNADVSNGVFILESTIEHNSNLGVGVVLQRNNIHNANLQDVSGSWTTVNVWCTNSQWGAKLPFVAQGEVKIWDPTAVYVNGDKVLAQDENPASSVSPNGGTTAWSVWELYVTSGVYDAPGGAAAFDSSRSSTGANTYAWGRSDPHVDGWQPSVAPLRNTGSDINLHYATVSNVNLHGYYLDETAFMQPFINTSWGKPSVIDTVQDGISMVDWTVKGEQVHADVVRSRFQTPCLNMLWRNVDYKDATWDQYFGLLSIDQDGVAFNASGDRPSDIGGRPLEWAIVDSNIGNFTGSTLTATNGDSLATWIAAHSGPNCVVVSDNSTGVYGANSPSGTIALTGTETVGATLTVTPSISNASSITYAWERSTDSGSSWTPIAGETSTTYTLVVADQGNLVRVVVTAVGLPPNLVLTEQTGVIGAPIVSLGSMTFTFNSTSAPTTTTPSYSEVTDGSAVTGVFAAQGRYGQSTFNNNIIDATSRSIRVGPGYSDSGDSSATGGIYSSPTYAYTANDATKTTEWSDWVGTASNVWLKATVVRSGSGTYIGEVDLSTLTTQGGYVNISLANLGFNSSLPGGDYVVGDVVTVETYQIP